MNQTLQETRQVDRIVEALRRRICMEGAAGPIALRETELARTFGISRTPVRQALQLLAHEGLLVIRAGKETRSTPLDPGRRAREIDVARRLLHAASEVVQGTAVPEGYRTDFAALYAVMAISTIETADAALRAAGRLIAAMERIPEDPVVGLAIRSALWRAMRWMMWDVSQGAVPVQVMVERCIEDVRHIAAAGLTEERDAPLRRYMTAFCLR